MKRAAWSLAFLLLLAPVPAAHAQGVKDDTTTTVASSPNPSSVGDSVTFTATVTGGGSTPTGAVEFQDGGVVISECGTPALDVSGLAVCATSSLAVGSHSITAFYTGDDSYNTSTSPTLTQDVSKADTTTTVASSPNPSSVGDSVTFTATVTGGGSTPTGAVEFQDSGVVISECGTPALDVSGLATCVTFTLAVGSHSITASYTGDDTYNTSTSPTLTLDVIKADTTTTLDSFPNPSWPGASVTFTATVTGDGSTPTGTVEFQDGGTGIAGCAGLGLSAQQATCTTSALTPGTHTITAVYSGDAIFNGSTGTLSPEQQVNCLSTVTVANDADSGAGSLRQAIADVCTGGTVGFDSSLSGATITLSSPLTIGRSLTVTGPGAASLAISGDNSHRVVLISSGTVSISGLTVKNGQLFSPGDAGAGVLVSGGTVTIDSCAIDGCTILTANSTGAAIDVLLGATLTLTNSAVTSNQAERGGAITSYGTTNISNCTVSGNTSGALGVGGGGVVYNVGGIMTVLSCTITNNTALNYEGGLLMCGGTTILQNSIVAGNVAQDGLGDVDLSSSSGTITSQGYNIVGVNDGPYSAFAPTTGDQTGTFALPASLLSGALQDNGGPTSTHALLPGSPAVDAIPGCNGAPATDQRGIARPQGSACDIGAFESQGFTLGNLTGTPQGAIVNTAFATPLGLTVTATGAGEPVDGGQVTFTAPSSGASTSPSTSTATITGGAVSLGATANGTVGGPYTVTASAAGATSVSFSLTNTPLSLAPAITSGNAATFTVGTPGSFTVTTSGQPRNPGMTITETGGLPGGVTFTDHGDGTATLAGTPAPGSSGSYSLSFEASNGVAPNATQSFTLTVQQVPAITSADHVTFTVGAAGAFTVTTTGYPTSAIAKTGALPGGVTFTDNGNGTATLAGTPTAGSGGVWGLAVTASNGVEPDATQGFSLTVHEAPAITSGAATTFVTGAAGSFSVTTTGWPRPTLTSTGALPSGVTFTDNGNGTATLAGTPGATAGATFPLALSAANGVGSTAGQSFTLTVRQAPLLTSASAATFSVGVAGAFTVTTAGYPSAAIAMTGALPTGVTFHNNGNGTATLAGKPAVGTPGAYPLTFTAANATPPDGTQVFTLTVAKAPVLLSLRSSTNPSALGQAVVFTSGVTFTVRGIGTPTGTVRFTVDGTPLGSPVTLTRSSASSPSCTTLTVGSHAVRASYSGDATFAPATVVLGGGQIVNVYGTPTHAVYLQQPLDTEVWAQVSPAVVVELRDVADNVVTTPGINLTVALSSGTGALSGTLTRSSDAAGKVSFDDLVAETAGVKRLVITGTGLVPARSSIFTITQHAAPESLTLDQHNLGPANGNLDGVMDPGETVLVEPGWANQGGVPYLVTGRFGNLVGPGSARVVDETADYGSIAAGSSADPYRATGDTYAVETAIPTTRPATHWDITVDETLSIGAATTWTLHVGGSFTDVPAGYGGGAFYAQIETLLHTGVTLGCTATTYCPASTLSRAHLAMFVARAMAGSDAAIPLTGTVGTQPYDCNPGGASVFLDVAPGSQYCRHVNYLAAEDVANGCDATHFCPADQATRASMAELVARAVVGGDANVPLTYLDPTTGRLYSCNPAAATLHFLDVSTADSYCRHAHYLWATDVIGGCTSSEFCPTNLLTRVQMARFLVNGFGLTMYHP